MREDPVILCPIDLSDQSARALCWASVLARHFDTRVTVAHVDNPLLISAALAACDTQLLGGVTRPEIEEFVASVLPAAGGEALHTKSSQPVEIRLERSCRLPVSSAPPSSSWARARSRAGRNSSSDRRPRAFCVARRCLFLPYRRSVTGRCGPTEMGRY